MVRCRLNDCPTKQSRKNITKNTAELTEADLKNTVDTNKLLEIVNMDIDVLVKYNQMEENLTNMSNVKPSSNISNRNNFSIKTTNLIEERRVIMGHIKSKENQAKIANLSKQIKKSISTDRRERRLKTLEEHITKTGGLRKALKELRETGKEWIPKLTNKDRKAIQRKEIQKVATEYYRTLYSQTDTTIEPYNSCQPNEENYMEETEFVPDILTSEVEKAINSQKMEKAPGPDGIRNELLRGTIEDITPILTKMFNEILRTNNIPNQWGESYIILLHKKGDKDDINNYRPISLMSNVYKVFAKVLLERITKQLDENQPIEQAGFRKNYSTIDHIHTVKQILQKYNEYQKPLHVAFIDYAKAFDSLKHCYIWASLKEQGVNAVIINLIKNIYHRSKSSIKLESTGSQFPINRGARQGDPLSPKLFSAVLESIFRKLDWDDYGLNINGRRLNHLRFADDLILFEEDPKKLESMLKDLDIKSKEVGLEMNKTKTKLMTNTEKADIFLEDTRLEHVEEYVYLGQIISPSDQMSKEIQKRIAVGWKKYWALKEIMKSKELGPGIKKKTFDTCILPCITYGCETWSLTKLHRQKLERCQRAMERSMLGYRLRDRMPSAHIRRVTKLTAILTRVDRQKWRWTGHMLRCNLDKWSQQATLWYPRDGVRRKGRPAKRWEDDLVLTLGPRWTRVAADRQHWRELEEAYAERHSVLRDII